MCRLCSLLLAVVPRFCLGWLKEREQSFARVWSPRKAKIVQDSQETLYQALQHAAAHQKSRIAIQLERQRRRRQAAR
jgi:hypothetical protein